jgi:hypothetical protein
MTVETMRLTLTTIVGKGCGRVGQVAFGIHQGVIGGKRGITWVGLSHDLSVGRI